MAEEHPPSPYREDVFHSLRRLRVKPAMTARGEGSEVLRQKDTAYESNTKIPNPNNLRPLRDNGVLRQPDEADGTGASPI